MDIKYDLMSKFELDAPTGAVKAVSRHFCQQTLEGRF